MSLQIWKLAPRKAVHKAEKFEALQLALTENV